MSVPEEVLKALEKEVQGSQMQMPEEIEVVEEVEEVEEVEVTEEREDIDGDGFKSFDEYVADGGDPDFYRGKKAYQQQKDILAEMKALKKKTDDFMFQQEKRHAAETERLLKEIEKAKAEAKADLDFDRYEELNTQERELKGAHQQKNEGEAPVIAHYRNENPELNPAAPEFDPIYASAFAAAFNTAAMKAEQTVGRALNEAEIAKWLEATAKKLRPQPVATKKASKVSASTSSGGGKKDPVASLDADARALYNKWANSGDPDKVKWAKQMLSNRG